MSEYQVLLFYKYIPIQDPEQLMLSQRAIWQKLNLKGRMIIATEGINVTLEGKTVQTEKYIKDLIQDVRFKDIHFKRSIGNGQAFPKISIKVRPEIVASHLDPTLANPSQVTGRYISAQVLHEWIHSNKKFYIVDMRNDYEQLSGYFKDSILSNFTNFYDLPQIIEKIQNLKDAVIVTVCTGGVRCEKASGFLVNNGFSNVYQLYGGIVTYMEKYPNEDFIGKLYVFDNRLVMGFNTDSQNHQIVGKCDKCGTSCDSYVNCAYDMCHRHYICCQDCLSHDGKAYCDKNCQDKAVKFNSKYHPATTKIAPQAHSF